MDQISKKRYKQTVKGALKDSAKIAKTSGKSRISVFLDMLSCFRNHYVFASQYRDNKIWNLSQEERKTTLEKLGKENLRIDAWTRVYFQNRVFIAEYSSMKYEQSKTLMRMRYAAYAKHYNVGKG